MSATASRSRRTGCRSSRTPSSTSSIATPREDAVNPKPDSLADLPLVENGLPEPKGKPLAIIVTGDGGWASIDRDIGGAMNKSGVNVVGLNSLQYFWSEKTPEQSAKDLDRILRWYEDAWQPSSIMLIGYSLGAEALPFMVNNLPADQQGRIGTVAMLAVGHDATLAVHVADWLFASKHDGLPIKPEADKITVANRMCFYGEEETADSLCPTLGCRQVHHHQDQGRPSLRRRLQFPGRRDPEGFELSLVSASTDGELVD